MNRSDGTKASAPSAVRTRRCPGHGGVGTTSVASALRDGPTRDALMTRAAG